MRTGHILCSYIIVKIKFPALKAPGNPQLIKLMRFIALFAQEHVMFPTHNECQKFQILSPQLNVLLRNTGYLCIMKSVVSHFLVCTTVILRQS